MSVSKWAYDYEVCDGRPCPGDCDKCDIPKNPELYDPDLNDLELDEESEREIEQEIKALRLGEE